MVTIEHWVGVETVPGDSETAWRPASGPMRPCEARAVLAGEDESTWRAVDATTNEPIDIWAPAKV
jgi:hypothetical protein